MKTYFVIQGSEDGTQITPISGEINLAEIMEEYGIASWMTPPITNWDPNYWEEGVALLIKGEIVTPKEKLVVKEWEV